MRVSTIWVRTPTARYPIWVGTGLLGASGRRLRQLRPRLKQMFIVSSPRVWALWGRRLAEGLRGAGIEPVTLLTDDREEAKRLATVERLAEKLLGHGADRGAVVAALGGGVVGDVAGFLAATYMRGVACVQIPTTLVGQIDSAIGGKTGVNLRGGKNLLGAFHHPLAVLADVGTLETLPAREYRAGLYEAVKCAILGDAGLFRFLEENLAAVLARQPKALRRVLVRSIQVKARMVARDEHERGPRRALNLGHTFGHAFETLAGYRHLRHGEAVGWGLLAATRLAVRLGRLSAPHAERIERLVGAIGRLPALPSTEPEEIYAQLFADKKKQASELYFVLPRRLGRVEMVAGVPRGDILASLRQLAGRPPAR
ncbi:MAG: 3-dehydroquinate synthase [Acidobacteria bacterium]|nr:3-dehydroquinate synthase [Acidobacteriota bacterium]